MAPPAPDRRLGPARRVPESALWIAGPDGRLAAGLRLGAGKGLEFNVAAEAAARAQDQSRLGRRRATCPGQMFYGPEAKGAPTGPEVILFFRLPSLWQPETRHRRPAWPRLGPVCQSPYLQKISESLGPGMRPRGGGSWERDTGRRPGSGSDLLRPDSEAGREDPEPGKRGLGGQPVTPLARATQVPPVRRAVRVSTAAVRIGSLLTGRSHGEAETGPGQRRPGS